MDNIIKYYFFSDFSTAYNFHQWMEYNEIENELEDIVQSNGLKTFYQVKITIDDLGIEHLPRLPFVGPYRNIFQYTEALDRLNQE